MNTAHGSCIQGSSCAADSSLCPQGERVLRGKADSDLRVKLVAPRGCTRRVNFRGAAVEPAPSPRSHTRDLWRSERSREAAAPTLADAEDPTPRAANQTEPKALLPVSVFVIQETQASFFVFWVTPGGAKELFLVQGSGVSQHWQESKQGSHTRNTRACPQGLEQQYSG